MVDVAVDGEWDGTIASEVSGFRIGARFRDYSTLAFDYGGELFACVPLERSETGILVALPAETIPDDQLRAAAATGFEGLLGPFCFGSCRLRAASGRAVGSALRVLVIDLRVSALAMDEDGTSALTQVDPDGIDELWSFGGAPTGEARWLHMGGVQSLIDEWLTHAGDNARLSDYVTGDEHREALTTARSSTTVPGAPDVRPKARAKVKAAAQNLGTGRGPAARVATALVGAAPVGGKLSEDQIGLLLRAAGRGQGAGRIGASSKRRPPGPAPRDEDVEDDREDEGAEEEVETAAPDELGAFTADGLTAALGLGNDGGLSGIGPIVASLLMQNQGLLQHLTKQTRDPLQSALEGAPGAGESGDGQRGAGLRGVNARQAWVRMIRDNGDLVRDALRERLAGAMEVTVDSLQPAAMRGFFERKVPLGPMRGLTFFSYIVAKLWEYFEQGRSEDAHTLTALAAIFCEQTAVDGGRYQTGWLLTGLPQPSFNLTQANSQRNQEEPYALLADPTWISANLAYLKDMDYFEQRQRSLAQARQGGGQSSSSGAGGAVEPKRRPRRTPKSKAAPGKSE